MGDLHHPRGVRWPARAGAWLAIGTSPVAVFSGAGIARSYGDAPEPLVLLLAALVAIVLLLVLGVRGVQPPHGEGTALAGLLSRYVGGRTMTALSVLLAAAMLGWTGYYLGLAANALEGLSGANRAWFLLPLVVLGVVATSRGLARWNLVAVVLGSVFLVAMLWIGWQFAPEPSATVGAPPAMYGGAMVAFVGYVAVFSVRSPDFSVGLARRRDLVICALFLVVPAALLMAIGGGVQLALGEQPIEEWVQGSTWGSILLLVSAVAPILSALHTGTLAAVSLVRERWSPLLVGALMGAAAALVALFRIEQLTLSWLSVLAAALPPIVVPLGWEAWARGRGARARRVPLLTWLPAAVVGVVLAAFGQPTAAAVGIVIAALATAVWRGKGSRERV
ncbi:MAG TPA: hypothetical protein VKY66_03690 [Protaetiibacter sp.]|nr:hypothetical protein [Protaetiibacter sp.]